MLVNRLEISIMPSSVNILVANIGSTSFKYRAVRHGAGERYSRRAGSSGSGSPGATARTTTPPSARCGSDIAGEGKPLADLSDADRDRLQSGPWRARSAARG